MDKYNITFVLGIISAVGLLVVALSSGVYKKSKI